MPVEDLFEPPVYRPHIVDAQGGNQPVSPDPLFPRAAEWLSRGSEEPEALVVGLPFSTLSLSRARCDLLPSELRSAMWSFSTYSPSLDCDLADFPVRDLGDVRMPPDAEDALAAIESALNAMSERWAAPTVIVGGDNSVTAPAVQATVGTRGGLITLDAHHDVRDYKATGLSNGSPVRVLMDAGLDGERIWQLGIKDFSNSKAYSDYAERAGINIVRLPEVRESGVEPVMERALAHLSEGNIYVDIDLDVVDRGFAPGAPAAQPGGLHPSQVAYAAFMCGRHPAVKAIDVVEVDPTRDVAGITVRLACLVVLSFLAGVTHRKESL